MFRIAVDEDPKAGCRGPYWLEELGYRGLDYSLACCRRGTPRLQEQREKQIEREKRQRKQSFLRRLMLSEINRIEEEMHMESVH